MIETWTLLHHKLDREAAERFWEGLRSGIAAIETVTLAVQRVRVRERKLGKRVIRIGMENEN